MFVGGSGLSPWVWGGVGPRLKGSPPLCSPSPPYEGPPAGSGVPERVGKKATAIADSRHNFIWVSPPRGFNKRANLTEPMVRTILAQVRRLLVRLCVRFLV